MPEWKKCRVAKSIRSRESIDETRTGAIHYVFSRPFFQIPIYQSSLYNEIASVREEDERVYRWFFSISKKKRNEVFESQFLMSFYSYVLQVPNGNCWPKTRNCLSSMKPKGWGRCTWKSIQITNTDHEESQKLTERTIILIVSLIRVYQWMHSEQVSTGQHQYNI